MTPSFTQRAVELRRTASLDLRGLPGWDASLAGDLRALLAIDGRIYAFESRADHPGEASPAPSFFDRWNAIPHGQAVKVVLVSAEPMVSRPSARPVEPRHRDIDWDDLLGAQPSAPSGLAGEAGIRLDSSELESLRELVAAIRQRSPKDGLVCSQEEFLAAWPYAPLSAISMRYGSLVGFLRSEAPHLVNEGAVARAVSETRAAFFADTGSWPSDRATAMMLVRGDLGLVTPREVASCAVGSEQFDLPACGVDQARCTPALASTPAAEATDGQAAPSAQRMEVLLARHMASVREAADLLKIPTPELLEIKSQWRSLFAFLRELEELREAQ